MFLIVLIPLGLVGAVLLFRLYLHVQIQEHFAAMRAEGLPVTLGELDAWYPPVPEEDNAGPLFLQALGSFKSDAERRKLLPVVGGNPVQVSPGEPYPDEIVALMEEAIGANEEVFRLVRAAAAMPGCRYPVDCTQGSPVRLDHLARLRELGRFLCLRAHLEAERGQGDEAAATVSDILRVSRSLDAEPIFRSQLVRILIVGIAESGLARVLSRTQIGAESCARLAEELGPCVSPETWRRALSGERCLMLPGFSEVQPLRNPGASVMENLVPGGYVMSRRVLLGIGLGDLDMLYYLRINDRIMEAVNTPYPACLRIDYDAWWEELPQVLAWRTLNYLGGLSGVPRARGRHIAEIRCARTALAIERHRIGHGVLPPDLATLVPEYMQQVPIDPMDGNPLRYRRLERGYVVYSIGRDFKDDGGKIVVRPNDSTYEPDQTFRVLR